MKEMSLYLYAVLSALSLNLVLETGLGFGMAYKDAILPAKIRLLRWGSLFAVVFLFWLLWTYLFSPLALGFFDLVFIFPLCALALSVIDIYTQRKKPAGNTPPPHQQKAAVTEPENRNETRTVFGMTPLCVFALFLTLMSASSVPEAALLSFFFAAGGLAASYLLKIIHARAQGSLLAGKKILGLPYAYISAGLLAFIFSAVSSVLLN
jgi:hypothetical protein